MNARITDKDLETVRLDLGSVSLEGFLGIPSRPYLRPSSGRRRLSRLAARPALGPWPAPSPEFLPDAHARGRNRKLPL
jgi:hypothetical protein